MNHMEMKAMDRFPIEKLSYDLKLELLESMGPRDVVELVNVNQGFRSIIVKEPWQIVGKHVDFILINASVLGSLDKSGIEIEISESVIGHCIDDKTSNQIFLTLSGSSFHLLAPKTFATLISKIRTCQKLQLRFSSKMQGQEAAQLSTKLLGNLDSVEELAVWVEKAETDIEKYLTILAANHFNRATFRILFYEGMLGFLSSFFETRLNHSKSIEIEDRSGQDCSLWFESLSKIWTEVILITGDGGLIRRIVTNGIPSTNPEAAILLYDHGGFEGSIAGFLSQTPSVRRIARKDRGEVKGILEKLLLDELIPKSHRYLVNDLRGVYFARLIDSNRKWIYATDRENSCFFAKYTTIG